MKNLKDYILHLDNWIPKNILDKSLKELKKDKTWIQHQYHSAHDPDKPYNRNGKKELDISLAEHLTYLKELHQLTWNALEKYVIIDKIGGKEFNGWSGFNQIRFNRYKKNQIMSKHNDHIHNLFTGEKRGIPILSIVGVLNDNYEIKFKAGDLIVFPSVFLYPHLVKPIKKGTRYSFVSWAY